MTTILLVSDSPTTRSLVRTCLTPRGYTLVETQDAAAAMAELQGALPGMVLQDLRVSHSEQLELASRLRVRLGYGVPILAFTRDGPSDNGRHTSAFNDTICKPIDPARLLRTVEAHLPKRPVMRAAAKSCDPNHARMQDLERALEHQLAVNAGLARRGRALEAELRALASVPENALLPRDFELALDEGLLACFDSGEAMSGALYLLGPDDRFRVRTLGNHCRWSESRLRGFFGYGALLRDALKDRKTIVLPSANVSEAATQDLLDACQVDRLLIVPLMCLDRPLGVLLAAGRAPGEPLTELLEVAQGLAARITQMLVLASALAEESRARDRAEQQAALLNAWLLHAPDCVAHLEPSSRVLYVNPVMRAAQPELVVGSSWLAAQRPEHRELAQHAFDVVVSTGQSMSYETAAPLSAERARWYSNRLGPVRRDGEIVSVMLVARDITERKQAEAQLLVADRMASVGLLAASVAHEINNPLAAMMINFELMARDLAKPPSSAVTARLARELEGVREGGRRITQVARDLKIFSRAHDTLALVHVQSVLESSLRMAWNEVRHRARLSTVYSDVPAVHGDESRLGQVFLNLILNAAQAMPDGAAEQNELRVTTELDELARVVVSISDTGCGIPLEHRSRLFRPFFTTKPAGVGTGLGLSICDRIVRSMGGAIWFESEVGKGTTFHVALPCVEPPHAAARAVLEVDAPAALRRGRVLIVEDDQLVGDVVERFLGDEHDVFVVETAFEALGVIAHEPTFDVILCDLMMPQMSGQQLFRELTRIAPRQAERMVFMTGGTFTTNARAFLGSVPNHRLEKPFDLQVLRRLLAELIV